MMGGGLVQRDRTASGIAILLTSVTALAFGDAMVKLVSHDLTVWQVFVARSAFALPCLQGLARATGTQRRATAPGWVAMRSLLLVLTWLCYYASLPVLDLAVAAVAIYTNPILTSLLSAALLGWRVTSRQWLGVGLGFCGVVVILQPGSAAFSWAVLLPLMGAAFYSCAMVLTRSRCRDESAIGLAAALHVAFIATGAIAILGLGLAGPPAALRAAYPFLLDGWAPMSGGARSLMALLGLLSAAFSIGVARAYQVTPPPIAAVFDYGYLVSAALWDFFLLAERPGVAALSGMILIAWAGSLVAVPRGTCARAWWKPAP